MLADTEVLFRRWGTPTMSRGFDGRQVLPRAVPAVLALLIASSVGNVVDAIWYRKPGLWELPFGEAMERARSDDDAYFVFGLAVPVLLGVAAAAIGFWAARKNETLWSGRRSLVLVAATLLLPPVLAGIAAVDVAEAVEELAMVAAILAGILLAVRTGVAAVLVWAAKQALWNFADVLRLTSRALPLLLLFVTFLFINTENWQVASALTRPQLWGVAAFFGGCMLLFLSATLPRELARLPAPDEISLRDACRDTPLAPAVDDVLRHGLREHQLTRVERLNLLATMVMQQVMQAIMLGFVVWVFFILFGSMAISNDVIATWTGRPPEPGVLFPDSLELALPVSAQLIHVCVILGAFSALYFAVYTVNDGTYREEFLSELLVEIHRGRLVRDCYLTLLAMSPEPEPEPQPVPGDAG